MDLMQIYDALYEHFGAQHWWPAKTPFEVMVGAILTQNTNWQNVTKAIDNLKKANKLTLKALHATSEHELATLIKPAGYFNIKAKRLKNFVDYFVSSYDGSISRMKKKDTETLRRELLQVNGIGPETADSILLYALNKPIFVIDAYTKRILSRHGILPKDASYSEYQQYFHSHIPKDVALYNEYHALIVMTAKHYCKTKPLCSLCPLLKFA